MAYKRNKRKLPLAERQRRATNEALKASADFAVLHMKETIPPDYFTGGEYSQGDLVASIARTRVFVGSGRKKYIKYGSYGKAGRYARWWERGFWKHPAIYLRKANRWITRRNKSRAVWYHKPIWKPEFQKIEPEMIRIFRRVYRRILAKGR